MNTYTKLTKMPETHAVATARMTLQATSHAELIWGTDGLAVSPTFRPTDVARIITEKIAPQLLIAKEMAELERDIAQINLRVALARIAELEAL